LGPAETFTLPDPPAALMDALDGESEYVHCGGGGAIEAGGCIATAIGYTPTRGTLLAM